MPPARRDQQPLPRGDHDRTGFATIPTLIGSATGVSGSGVGCVGGGAAISTCPEPELDPTAPLDHPGPPDLEVSLGVSEATVSFLRDLDANNTREWFQANKKRYEAELKLPARALVDDVNARLATFAPDHVTAPNSSISRINRDIRFSHDKTPYNVKVWAKFMPSSAPKGGGAGYYFGFDLEGFGVGAGAWMFPKEKLHAIRGFFAANHDEYLAIVQAPDFAAYRDVTGDGLKRVPKPWPADHPAAELLKLKGIHTRTALDLALVTTDAFTDVVEAEFRKLTPFVRFVQRALDA